jgi:hypothetical protein
MLNSIGSKRSFPASILEKSRISSMMASSDSADALTMFRYSRCSRFSSVSRASSVMPRMRQEGTIPLQKDRSGAICVGVMAHRRAHIYM